MDLKIRKSDLPFWFLALLFILSVIYTITGSSLVNSLYQKGLLVIDIYLGMIVVQRLKYRTSVTVKVGIVFAIWVTLSITVVQGIDPYRWLPTLTWPYLMYVVATEPRKECVPSWFLNGFSWIVMAFTFITTLMVVTGREKGTDTIYQGYNLITFLPFIYFQALENPLKTKKRTLFTAFSVICMALMAKRGGIFALALALVMYYLCKVSIEQGGIKRLKYLLRYIFSGIVIVIIAIVIAQRLHLGILDRMRDLTYESGSSGRNLIWEMLVSSYSMGSIKNKIFGFGYNATYNISLIRDAYGVDRGTAAHNDYIGILYNFGLISMLLLIVFLICVLIYFFKKVKSKSPIAPIIAMSIGIFTIFSAFSICAIGSIPMCFISVLWGSLLNRNVEIVNEE